MHVGEGGLVNLNRPTDFLTAIGDPDRFIRKRPIFGEAVHPSGEIFAFRHLMCVLLFHFRS
jgi:hypothetical protein